ncbi:hypothetical protein TBR22_A40210 [Luteitalea sp. TBR-22]|uniref:hypothetical protein n=1 Tax=Luteitalea sp. TBR-22 TaxID=2802971 RepID=UPI001AF23E11|nr:hypothetical protein [Luteitalea sp. TBR-22]BCS34795.1 hypothetical protein TBR22_A40210 [Luteitalea sp. TBR-22]
MSAGKRLDSLAMPCPSCGQSRVPPLAGSTLTIAWYACDCGHFWSARVRDGRPVSSPPATNAPLPSSPR